jgi:hypothetical protein
MSDWIDRVSQEDFDWRYFQLLFLMSVVAGFLSLPLITSLSSAATKQRSMLPLIVFHFIYILISSPILIGIGINLSKRFAFKDYLWLALRKIEIPPVSVKTMLRNSLAGGLAVGVTIAILASLLQKLTGPPPTQPLTNASALQMFLISGSAGISEEITFRFFWLMVFLWILNLLFKGSNPRAAVMLFWSANLLSALLFGMAHLPNLRLPLSAVDPWLIVGVVALNCAAGLSFGWFFYKYGILSAMIVHGVTDVVLHVIPRMVM